LIKTANIRHIALFVLCIFSIQVYAQTTIKMTDGLITACSGKRTDSDGNTQSPRKHAGNED